MRENGDEPRLDAPGAGLPAVELFVGRCLFALRRWAGNRDSFTARFEREHRRIGVLVAGTDRSRRSQRVLIARPRGLEDSSRYWSVWMTLDHLRITNALFANVVRSLMVGRVPQREASTAAVKPDPDAGGAVEEAFEDSCASVLKAAGSAGDLKTDAKYAHPWFGPLDAAGWHALAAVHMAIHRGQIERIARAL